MSFQKRMRRYVGRPAIEPLERRQLLSADLSATFGGRPLKAFSLQRTNAVTVHVANMGDATATGALTVALFASTSQTLDGTATQIASVTTRSTALRAKRAV